MHARCLPTLAFLFTCKRMWTCRTSPEASVVKSNLPWCSLGCPTEMVTDLRKIGNELWTFWAWDLICFILMPSLADDKNARSMAVGFKRSVLENRKWVPQRNPLETNPRSWWGPPTWVFCRMFTRVFSLASFSFLDKQPSDHRKTGNQRRMEVFIGFINPQPC